MALASLPAVGAPLIAPRARSARPAPAERRTFLRMVVHRDVLPTLSTATLP
jgi:hypothetical protein